MFQLQTMYFSKAYEFLHSSNHSITITKVIIVITTLTITTTKAMASNKLGKVYNLHRLHPILLVAAPHLVS